KQEARARARGECVMHRSPARGSLRGIDWKARAELVAVGRKVKEHDIGSICGLPPHRVALRPARASEATPNDRHVEPEPARDQRQRSGVTERVRVLEDRWWLGA